MGSLNLLTLAVGLLALASARSPYRRAEYFRDFDDYPSVRPADLYAQKLELEHLRREVAQERAMLRDMNFQRLHVGHQYQQQQQQPPQPQPPQPPQPQQPQQQPKQAPTSCSSCGLVSFFVTLAFGALVFKALFQGPCFLMGALPWVVLFFFSFLAANIFVPLLSFLGFLLWAAPLPAFLVALFFLPDFKCVSRKWGSCGPRGCTATDSNNNAATEGSSLPATPLARGARGPAVAKLQDILIQLGHLHPSAVRFAKGIYGPRTAAAIAALQKTQGLAPTGTYDAAVRTVLQQPESDTSILPAAPLSHGARGPAVAQLQDALIAAGLMNADHPYIRMGKGMFGPYTAQIVATLQRDVLDVTPTGVYDNAVRSYLLALPSATPEA